MRGKKRILIVDDDSRFLDSFQIFLKISGYEAVKAVSPVAGKSMITGDPSYFDLVISDFEMPGTDGVDFLTAVSEIERQGKTKVHKRMILSGVRDHPKINEALRNNIIHRFISKGEDSDRILGVIEELLKSC